MEEYYQERTPVYDRVYSYPERQADLRQLEIYIPEQFKNLEVIEIAAGTGYWTQFLSQKAKSVYATDITKEALSLINSRELVLNNVSTEVLDVYSITRKNHYEGLFAGLWYSHVLLSDLPKFYKSIHKCLAPGATVLFIDNSLAQCDRLPITFTDESGNTFQDRILDSGKTHRILKNFPKKEHLISSAVKYGRDFIYKEFGNYWLFQYTCI